MYVINLSTNRNRLTATGNRLTDSGNRLTDTENTLGVAKGERDGGGTGSLGSAIANYSTENR